MRSRLGSVGGQSIWHRDRRGIGSITRGRMPRDIKQDDRPHQKCEDHQDHGARARTRARKRCGRRCGRLASTSLHRRIDAGAVHRQPGALTLGQQRQNRRRVDLEGATHTRRQGTHKDGIRQHRVVVCLQRLQFAHGHLQRNSQGRDVHAGRLPGFLEQTARRHSTLHHLTH